MPRASSLLPPRRSADYFHRHSQHHRCRHGIVITIPADVEFGSRSRWNSLAGLIDVLAHSGATVQLESADDGSAMKEVCAAYWQIDYKMEDEVGSSVVCLGELGVTTEILRRAGQAQEA